MIMPAFGWNLPAADRPRETGVSAPSHRLSTRAIVQYQGWEFAKYPWREKQPGEERV
jgi:hypothetical protein